jgi:hypothetical protein
MARRTTAETAVAVVEPQQTALTTRQQGTGAGMAQMGQDDIQIPRLSIAQRTSPQVDRSDPEYIDGLEQFQMFNSVTRETYGFGPIPLIFVNFRKYAMQFDDQNNVVDPNVPLNDARLNFTKGPDGRTKRPAATLFMEYLALNAETLDPIVVTFKGAGLATAKRLNTLLRLSGDIWNRKFLLSSERRVSGAFTFGAFKVQPSEVTTETQREEAKMLYEALGTGKVSVVGDPEERAAATETEF